MPTDGEGNTSQDAASIQRAIAWEPLGSVQHASIPCVVVASDLYGSENANGNGAIHFALYVRRKPDNGLPEDYWQFEVRLFVQGREYSSGQLTICSGYEIGFEAARARAELEYRAIVQAWSRGDFVPCKDYLLAKKRAEEEAARNARKASAQ